MPKVEPPFETLLADLRGADWAKRCDAARSLGKSRDPRAVDALLPDLEDADWRVRRNAAQALGALKSPRALEPLMNALKDRTSTVRQRAAVALGRIKDPSTIPALIEALYENKKYQARFNEGAYQAIRKFGRKAGPHLAELLKTNPDATVIGLLAESKYEGTADAVIPLISHENPFVRSRALSALAQTGDPRTAELLLNELVNGGAASQTEAIRLLGQLQVTEAIPNMLGLLQGDDLFGPQTGLYRAITDAFQNLSGIKSQVENSYPGKSPLTLHGMDGPTSLPEAMSLLGEEGFLKLNTLLADMEARMEKLGMTLGMPPEVTQGISDHTWKFGSMFADAREGRVERVKLLIELLRSGPALAQAAAALSLPWYMDAQALGPLEQATNSTDETVKHTSTWALAALKLALHNQQLLRGGE